MTNPQRQMDDLELNAFIDGELDTARRLEVAKMIESDPVLAERFTSLEGDKALLRKLYAPVAEKPIPGAWRTRIESYAAPKRNVFSYRNIAAMAAAFVLGIAAFAAWHKMPVANGQDIVTLALNARSGVTRPDTVIARAGPDVANKAVSEAMQLHVKTPDLSRLGYTLAAVQVYSGSFGEKPVELVYRNSRNQSFMLYLHRPVGALGERMLDKQGLRVCVWQYEELGAVMSGQMSWPEMLHLAGASYSIFRS